jgi:outer membrane biosynthesis protein TonB
MSQQGIENFLNKLHSNPAFEFEVRDALLQALSRFELDEAEREAVFSEGILKLELAVGRLAMTMQVNVPPPPPRPPHPKPKPPKKKPAKKPGKPAKKPVKKPKKK